MYNTLKKIYDKTDKAMFSCAISYLLDKGIETGMIITDDDIKSIQGNNIMTQDYCQVLLKVAREIAQNTESPVELIQFCDAISLFDVGFYTNGKHLSRSTLEKAMTKALDMINHSDLYEWEDKEDVAEQLGLEIEELETLERGCN